MVFKSIIIPNYNSESTISSCLNSIFSQNQKKLEVIVVDDNSTDKSLEIIRKFRTKIIRNKENSGPAYSRNVGAKEAKGDILIFMDSDVIMPKNFFESIDKNIKRASAIVFMPQIPSNKSLATIHYLTRINYNYLNMDKFIDTVYGSLFVIKKKIFRKIGMFDEFYKTPSLEDTDLGNRLYNRGYKILLLKSPRFIHIKTINFLHLIRIDFIRSYQRIKYLLRKRKLRSILKKRRFISTPLNHIISMLLAPIIIISLFFSVIIFVALMLVFTTLNFGYLSYVNKNFGLSTSIKIYFLMIIDYNVIFFGVVKGFFI